MVKNPFKSIGKFFTKSANKVADTAKSIFSKNNMNTFRDVLGDTLSQQGKILSTVGKIGLSATPALAMTLGVLQPELLPVIAGLGLASGVVAGAGGVEIAGSNLLNPKIYKGKNALQTTSAVTNQIEKAAKGVAQITKFA